MMQDTTLADLQELRRSNPMVRALPKWVWKLVLRWYRGYLWLMQQPALRSATAVLLFFVVVGAAYALEPFSVLRWRRRRIALLHPWAAPTDWGLVQNLADQVQALLQHPIVRLIISVPKALLMIAMIPLVVGASLVLNPSTARSILLLTLVPIGVVQASHMTQRELADVFGLYGVRTKQFGIISAGATAWLVVLALLVVGSVYYPAWLEWAVADVPLNIYMLFLGIALTFAVVATMLHTDYQRQPDADAHDSVKTLQTYHRDLTAVVLLAFVLGLWVMRLFNPLLFARDRLERGG
jgi:hypothetical protein